MPRIARFLLLGILLLAVSIPAVAQSARGTITGVVKDPSGAVVPGAEITVTDKDTGVTYNTVSTEAGVYRTPYVPPGKYKITATLTGFKTAVADNVDVMVAQTVTVDLALEVGQVSDQVTVLAQTPILESSTSEIGINTTEKEVHTWPILVGDGTRQLQTFMFNSLPGTEGGTFAGTINGGQSYSHEILIEGMSIGRFDLNGGSNNEFTPTIDAVSEFKLQTGALSSQYGNTQTALTNFGMKSGTNEYHGSAFWFNKQPSFNANSWGYNLNRAATDPTKEPGAKENNLGATFGGPVWIPGVYNGKDKTFFFFSYEIERYKNQSLAGSRDSLPVAAFKQGDFSQLFDPAFTGDSKSGTVVGKDALGRDVIFGQIYDPTSSRQLPNGAWIRDPFPGNIIPTDRFSGVTSKILKYDLPNPLVNQLRRNNPKINDCCPFLEIDNLSIKVDHVINSKHKASATYVKNDRGRKRYGASSSPYLPGPIPYSEMAGEKFQNTPGNIARVAEDWTISPTMINHFAIGYNRFLNANNSYSYLEGTDWAQTLGLTNVGTHKFPEIQFGGNNNTLSGSYPRMGGVGGTGGEPNGSTIFSDDFTWIKGAHSFRFGAEHRRYYLNSQTLDGTGTYSFHNENTGLPGVYTDAGGNETAGPDSTGFAYASFLLGEARSTSFGVNRLTPGTRSRVTAFYVQDDWKVKSNLTLNIGFRWDIPTGLTEVAQRMSGLDPTKPNPGADGYPGALVFLGNCAECTGKGRWVDPYYKEFSPRVGFAWSPANSNKMVVRGGYGINYSPPIQDGWASWQSYFIGFNGSDNINARTGRFREDPSYSWDTPYKPFTATLPNYDPAQLNGDYIAYYRPDLNKWPMVQNWNFGIQYEFPWQTKVEANYVGNRGSRLNEVQYVNSLNALDTRYMSLGNTLLDDISSHPEIKKPYASFEGTVSQALRPFPQYYGVAAHRLNGGWSNYHSLQLTVTKRSSFGLSFLAAYTFSKALGTADTAGPGNYYDYGQDYYNRTSDYSVTAYNFPQDLKLTWIYDLPFGPQGHWLRNGIASKILGGWTMSAIHRYRSGAPLTIGGGGEDTTAMWNFGMRGDVLLPRDKQVLNTSLSTVDPDNGTAVLNPAAFGNPPLTSLNVPVRWGNAPRHQPDLRGFMARSEDFSLIKRTALGFREGANFELRMDVVNLFNRVQFNDPNTNTNDPSTFGRTYGKGGGPRTIQLGLRITF